MDEKHELHYPFSLYPGYPCQGGYTDYDLYNKEVQRALIKIKELTAEIDGPSLFHLAVGAAMDEMLNTNNISREKYGFQFYQLYPSYLENYFATNVDGKINLMIISPNSHFSNDVESYRPPEFIRFTDEIFDWEEVEPKHYQSKNYDFNVYIFCCPMPHENRERIRIQIERLRKIDLTFEKLYGEGINQTEQDAEFILDFYKSLGELFDVVNEQGGVVTCLSSAVFKNRAIYNYAMFSEIKKLFGKGYDFRKRLLMEWRFKDNNFFADGYNICLCINYGIDINDKSYKGSSFTRVIEIVEDNRDETGDGEHVADEEYDQKSFKIKFIKPSGL